MKKHSLEPWEADFNDKLAKLETALNAITGKYQVQLSNVGNPDHRQDPSRPLPETTCGWARVNTFQEAAALCQLYITFYDLGGGNWSGGDITETTSGLVVAYVTYGGNLYESRKLKRCLVSG